MNHEKKEKEGEEDGVWNLNLHDVAMEMGDCGAVKKFSLCGFIVHGLL